MPRACRKLNEVAGFEGLEVDGEGRRGKNSGRNDRSGIRSGERAPKQFLKGVKLEQVGKGAAGDDLKAAFADVEEEEIGRLAILHEGGPAIFRLPVLLAKDEGCGGDGELDGMLEGGVAIPFSAAKIPQDSIEGDPDGREDKNPGEEWEKQLKGIGVWRWRGWRRRGQLSIEIVGIGDEGSAESQCEVDQAG